MTKLPLCVSVSAFALCPLLTAPALAQENSDGELTEVSANEILVTERRAYRGDFDELETPQINQVIDEDLLRDANALDLNQALDLSASVARQNNFGGLWNAFSVRGFQGDINLPSGFLVNGFNAGRGFGGPRDISGVEAVEVLKGPRSALYGRGEPGGTVNLVTKRPQFETSGYAQFQGGSFDFYRGDVDVQTSLGDNIGVRVAGFYEDAGSFRGPIESQRFGIYPSVTALLGEATTITYELEYSEQDIPFDRGVVFAEEFGFSPITTFTGEPQDGPIETDVLGHQLELQHDFSENWNLLAGVGFRDTTLVGGASENNFLGRQTFNLDGQTISRFFRFRDFDSEYFVARAEISGQFETGSLTHNLIFGADYDSFDSNLFINRFRGPFIGTDPSIDVATLDAQALLLLNAFNPVFGQFPSPAEIASLNTDRVETLDGFGFYLQDQIEITDQLQVRIGGRFDSFDQSLSDFGAVPSEGSFDRFSPQFGIVYLADEGLSFYGSYGEGFRQQTGSDFEGNGFDPNITESYEIGAKLDLGAYSNSVSGPINLTLFHIEQSNILANDDRPGVTGFFLFTAGEARSRGLEFDANVSFDSGLNLFLSYAHTDAEFTNNTLEESGFGAMVEAGDALINSPRNQLAIQASQDFEIGNTLASVGGGMLHVGSRNGFTGFDFDLPAYTTARAFAEIEIIEGVLLRADVDNIFDETFFTNSFADVWVQPGSPRTFRGTIRYSF
jgi:iron complex outermembrane receptor protein